MRRLLASLIATVVLVGLLVVLLDVQPADLGAGVSERLGRLDPGWVALAFLVYFGSYLGRAVRLAILIPGASGLAHLTSVCARHNLLNLVLPFRSGEVALPWMLKREAGHSFARSTAALVVMRVLDLLSVAVYLTTGLVWWRVGGDEAQDVAPKALGILVALVTVVLVMRPLARWAERLGQRVQAGRKTEGVFLRGLEFASRAAGHLGELGQARLVAAVFTSLVTWLLTYTTYYCMVMGMAGPDPVGTSLGQVTFARSLVGTTGLHLSTVLPVNTVAGVGAWEAGWIGGYIVFAGLDETAATISAVVSHLLNLGFILVIGGLGFALRRRLAPKV